MVVAAVLFFTFFQSESRGYAGLSTRPKLYAGGRWAAYLLALATDFVAWSYNVQEVNCVLLASAVYFAVQLAAVPLFELQQARKVKAVQRMYSIGVCGAVVQGVWLGFLAQGSDDGQTLAIVLAVWPVGWAVLVDTVAYPYRLLPSPPAPSRQLAEDWN